MQGSKRRKQKSALEMSAVQNSLLIGAGGPVPEIAHGESDAGSADSNRSLESFEGSLFTRLSEFDQERCPSRRWRGCGLSCLHATFSTEAVDDSLATRIKITMRVSVE